MYKLRSSKRAAEKALHICTSPTSSLAPSYSINRRLHHLRHLRCSSRMNRMRRLHQRGSRRRRSMSEDRIALDQKRMALLVFVIDVSRGQGTEG